MPWAPVTDPPLGIAILRAALDHAGIASRVFHLNLRLLRYLKYETYYKISEAFALNDFVFSGVLDPSPVSSERFKRLIKAAAQLIDGNQAILGFIELILKVRSTVVENYLDECLGFILAERPTLVGFTCGFDQTFASLALAHRIRQASPGVLTAFGGYGVNGETGQALLETFPCVDCIAQGDSEETIVDLALASIEKMPLSDVPGIQFRGPEGITSNRRDRVSLDDVPVPNFSDFFHDKTLLEDSDGIVIETDFLPVETSRGCWWGQKHHCVFCGIDEFTMEYRSRSTAAAISMLDEVYHRYRIPTIRLNDYILPHQYHKTLIPELIKNPRPYALACEAKANLTREQVENMSKARFTDVQPGIESFSTNVLKAMKKGVTGSQNVFLLVCSREMNINIHFNILHGLPGETREDYEKLCKLIPMLYHLRPPVTYVRAQFTRYSPLQEGRVNGCDGSTLPDEAYDVILSKEFLAKSGFDMSKYCYYFQPSFEPGDDIEEFYTIIEIQCNHWRGLWQEQPPSLTYDLKEGRIVFRDTRRGKEAIVTDGSSHAAVVFKALTQKPIGREELVATVTDKMDEEEVLNALEELDAASVVAHIDNKLVALAVPENQSAYKALFEDAVVAA